MVVTDHGSLLLNRQRCVASPLSMLHVRRRPLLACTLLDEMETSSLSSLRLPCGAMLCRAIHQCRALDRHRYPYINDRLSFHHITPSPHPPN